MQNYTLYSELITEHHNITCELIEMPEVITEYALHYGITADQVRITKEV